MNKDLNKAILRCKSVISLPAIYQKVTVKIDHPLTTNNELAEIVKLDAGISTKLLAIVNSSFYGFPSQISTISHAISLVGLRDFKNLVLGSSVVKQFEDVRATGFPINEFWDYSLHCAIAAKTLGKLWAGRQEQEALFIAGLLHDVGKLVIAQACQDRLDEIQQIWPNQQPEQERELIGFDHAEAGAELIKSWGLPELLSCATRQHHQLDLAETPEATVLCVYMANAIACGEENRITSAIEICNQYVEEPLTPEALEEMQSEIMEEKRSLIGVYLSG
ncbi:HDOD domain-containing protein [Neptuniibacter sp.]|uniref:HDOD domain-containing protein n=1 Tax=Neptuniibacter sp. TaxID=1962643 RepID=UPI002633F797|nr:HDOD domain-containing protein [Neptuniibacter sp.]MCP4597357.1 HDOD domain-containing protein [Neptuniibacter sp.]